MQPIFRQTYTISTVHLDCFGRVKPSVLLLLAQESAVGHCAQLLLDWDTMAKKNLFWAVIRHRVQVTRLPVDGETVTVETWPMPTTRSAFPRATVAYDAQGNELFRSVSLWVLMDMERRTMVLPGKSGVWLDGTLRGCELATPGSILPKHLENTATRRVGFTELDRNGHMNNTRYMDWVDDLLPSAFHAAHPIKEFTVCYLSEAREGQKIDLNWQMLEGNLLQVDGRRERTDVSGEQDRVFAVQALF